MEIEKMSNDELRDDIACCIERDQSEVSLTELHRRAEAGKEAQAKLDGLTFDTLIEIHNECFANGGLDGYELYEFATAIHARLHEGE